MTDPIVPVHDARAEQIVAVEAFSHEPQRVAILGRCSWQDFFLANCNALMHGVQAVVESGTTYSVQAVVSYLQEHGLLARAGNGQGIHGLEDVCNNTPAATPAECAAHAERVHALAQVRRTQDTMRRALAEQAAEDPWGWCQRTLERIAELAPTQSILAESGPMGWADIFTPLEPIPYLIEALGVCAGSPLLFAGYGFSGKTTVTLSAVVSLCAQLPVWGLWRLNRRLRVGVLDYEAGKLLTRIKLQRLCIGQDVTPDDVGPSSLRLLCHPDMYLDDPKAEDWLCQFSDGLDLVVIDPWRAACPTCDENKSEARRPLDVSARVSQKTGAAFWWCHHARKPPRERGDDNGGARMAIRGSGAFYDASGSVVVLEGEKGQPPVMHHEKAKTHGRTLSDLRFRIDDVELGSDPKAGLVVTAEAMPTPEAVRALTQSRRDESAKAERLAKTAKLRSEVTALFEAKPTQGGADVIAGQLGRKAADVRACIALLRTEGLIRVEGTTSDRRHVWTGEPRP